MRECTQITESLFLDPFFSGPNVIEFLEDVFCRLSKVLERPHRLEVGVMEAHPLLGLFREVEGCAWPSVVEMPFTDIVPTHSFRKLRFDVIPRFFNRAPK